jgi:hypothetical protein
MYLSNGRLVFAFFSWAFGAGVVHMATNDDKEHATRSTKAKEKGEEEA